MPKTKSYNNTAEKVSQKVSKAKTDIEKENSKQKVVNKSINTDKKANKSEKEVNKNAFTRLKGMKDIRGQEFYNLQGMFEKSQEIAEYYGFKPIEIPAMERVEVFQKTMGENSDAIEKELYSFSIKGGTKVALRPEYTAGVIRSYIENGMLSEPQPISLYSYGPVWRHDNPQLGRFREFRQFNLEMIGTDKPVADALIIRTIYDILEEFGLKDITVDINSIGGKETRKVYEKDLIKFFKKHIDKLSDEDRQRLISNPLRILDSKDESIQDLKLSAPVITSYLSPQERKHFKDVLQFLEEMNIAYRINTSLVRGLDYYNDTVFEFIKIIKDPVSGEEKEITITGGGRYDLSHNFGHKKQIPAVGSGIGLNRVMLLEDFQPVMPKILKPSKFFFVQLGLEAKLKSLNILQILRRAGITVYQSIAKDSLGDQLSLASDMDIPFALIFGQKEAMSNCIILKDMKKQTQETICIEDLVDTLKKIK